MTTNHTRLTTFILAGGMFLTGGVTVALGQSCLEFTYPEALNNNADTDSGGDYYPQLTTDRLGNWVAVWYSIEDLGGTIGTDSDILVARSMDNGVTWTDPAPLNNNAAADSGTDYEPQVTTDGAGNWVAVWRSDDDLGSGLGTDYDILVARSVDNGVTWTDPAPLNNNAATDSGVDKGPQVTSDGVGNWVAMWESTDDLGLALGPDYDILVARSVDNGVTWTDPAPLNSHAPTDSGTDYEPQMTTDGAGNWVAVWCSEVDLGGTIGSDDDILVARSVDNGATWTDPAPLNNNAATDSENDRGPQVTTDGGGNWVGVWYSEDDLVGTIGTDWDILVARSVDNGVTWTDVTPLNNNAVTDLGDDLYPQVTIDGAGNWVAVWLSNEDVGGTIGADDDILVARSVDNGLTWTDPAPLNDNAATDSGTDYFPQVTTDGAGNWVAVWESRDDLGGTIWTDWDILIARFPFGQVLYVDANATDPTHDGSSWCGAYLTLDEALDASTSGVVIRVADGTYTPDTNGLGSPRLATFQLIDCVTIEGGYAGCGAPDPDERDIDQYETILSGDLHGDDVGTTGTGENSYHVVTGSGTDATAVLDGFTIMGGNANYDEFPHELGGGMLNFQGSPTVTNCTFNGNSAEYGGGMRNYGDSSPMVTNCTFSGNASARGGAMDNWANSNPLLVNCTFSGNSADEGGGIENYASSPTLVNCLFSGNAATYGGGGMANFLDTSNPTLVNCTFSGNSAGWDGGGMDNTLGAAPTLTNCVLWNNEDQSGTVLPSQINGGAPVVAYSCIQDDDPDDGSIPFGGEVNGNVDDDPLFVDADGPDDIPGTQDDNVRLQFGSPCIDAGSNGAVPPEITTDLDGNPRFVDDPAVDPDPGAGTPPIVDLGAYEFPQPLYADDSATGAGDGSSWCDAYPFLQDALAAAAEPGRAVVEIRVGAGTYLPDDGAGITPGDREATFQLLDGVAVRGGFAGCGAPDPNERDIDLHETVLSGDLNGNDVGTTGREENSYHVVTGSGTDATAVLDGFTVKGGNADWFGGGMFNHTGSPTVTDCAFDGNVADGYGGGMWNEESNPTLTNCTFSGNSAGYGGGGVFNYSGSSPTLTNCTFSGNSADQWSGGGMFNEEGSNPTLTNCTFSGNSAGYGGGGVYNYSGSSPALTNCTFSGNSANSGGGMFNENGSNPTVTNCIFWGNSDTNGMEESSQVYDDGTATTTVSYSLIQGLDTFAGNGNTDGNPRFVDADGPDDVAGTGDDDLRLSFGSPCIDAGSNGAVPSEVTTDLDGNPRFFDDLATDDTGAGEPPIVDMGAYEYAPIYVDDNGPNDPGPGDPTISDPAEDGSADHPFDAIQEAIDASTNGDTVVVFNGTYAGVGNRDLDFGGRAVTVRSANGSDSTIIDCQDAGRAFAFYSGETETSVVDGFTLTNGSASSGGAINCNWSSPTITNCTIAGNATTGGGGTGGGIYCDNASPVISNCTITDNQAVSIAGGIACSYSSSPTITSCTIAQNTAGNHGGGIWCGWSSNPTITNCTITLNTASEYGAGGIGCWTSSSPAITNCTITLNTAGFGGGVCSYDNSSPTITNAIVWGNSADQGPQIALLSPDSSLTVSYSAVQGGQAQVHVQPSCDLVWGDGNTDDDPLFLDPDGPDDDPETWNDNDYHLTEGSPCIDAADSTAVPPDGGDLDHDGNTAEPTPLDLDGDPRFVDDPNTPDTGVPGSPVVDMGAYEYWPDCNGNHLADECDIDCDAQDGACDLPGCGQSADCNASGIPDECELAAGTSSDCNNNDVPDECDIAAATSLDGDTNGVPDECVAWDDQAGDHYWSTKENWDNDNVPGIGNPGLVESVVIDLTWSNVILDVDASIDSLILGEGTTLNVTLGDLIIDASNGIKNNGTLIVGPGHAIVAEEAMPIKGTRPVDLAGVTASVSSASASDTVTSFVTIQGHGAIDAAFANEDTVLANSSGLTLSVEGPNAKVNNGLFEASGGATLRITNADVQGSGTYRADGGQIMLTTALGPVSVAGTSLEIVGSNGSVIVDGDASIDLSGPVVINTNGTYQPTAGPTSASLTADSVWIGGNGAMAGGQMLVSSTMSVEASGSITVDGGAASPPPPRGCTPPVLRVREAGTVLAALLDVSAGGVVELGEDSVTEVDGMVTVNTGAALQGLAGSSAVLTAGSVVVANSNGVAGQMHLVGTMDMTINGDLTLDHCGCVPEGRGCTPPVLTCVEDTSLVVTGTMVLGEAADIAIQSSQSVVLGGDFENHSTDPAWFQWDSGGLLLDGTTLQVFEVAGTDVGASTNGFVGNFAVGELEVSAGASVRFVDAFDNDTLPQVPCGEALYVRKLVLRAGAAIELDNCRIYCTHLTDEGASVTPSGCGEIVIVPTGDFDGDGDVDLEDYAGFEPCLAGPGISFADPACAAGDFDGDTDVDLFDFAVFQEAFTG